MADFKDPNERDVVRSDGEPGFRRRFGAGFDSAQRRLAQRQDAIRVETAVANSLSDEQHRRLISRLTDDQRRAIAAAVRPSGTPVPTSITSHMHDLAAAVGQRIGVLGIEERSAAYDAWQEVIGKLRELKDSVHRAVDAERAERAERPASDPAEPRP